MPELYSNETERISCLQIIVSLKSFTSILISASCFSNSVILDERVWVIARLREHHWLKIAALARWQRTQSESPGQGSRWTLLEVQGAKSRVEVPPRCPAAAGTSRLPPSFLCQAAVGGHTEGGPVRGLGTKQPRLSQSHPASLPFYVCPMLGWHPPTAGGIKIALWRKVQSPWAREALERILSVVTDQRRAWS